MDECFFLNLIQTQKANKKVLNYYKSLIFLNDNKLEFYRLNCNLQT